MTILRPKSVWILPSLLAVTRTWFAHIMGTQNLRYRHWTFSYRSASSFVMKPESWNQILESMLFFFTMYSRCRRMQQRRYILYCRKLRFLKNKNVNYNSRAYISNHGTNSCTSVLFVYINVFVNTCVSVYLYVRVCVMCVCMYVCVCVYICVFIYIVCVCVCMFLCVCVWF